VCVNAGGAFRDPPYGWKNVLLVTSHPDDESMFFGPSIQTLRRMGAHVHILCLSNGGADGLGSVRTKELEEVRAFLGIHSLKVVDDLRMKDGFEERWPAEVIELHVEASVRRVAADVVLTFDAQGVSGHPNHIATYRGVLSWMANEGRSARISLGQQAGKDRSERKSDKPKVIQVWALVSTNIVRKFLMMIDVFATYFLLERRNTLVAASNPIKLMRAMSMHRSQWVWYRKLFIMFSRYSYVNTLKQLTVQTDNASARK